MSLADYLQQFSSAEQATVRQKARQIREGSAESNASSRRADSASMPREGLPTRSFVSSAPMSLRDPSQVGRKVSKPSIDYSTRYADAASLVSEGEVVSAFPRGHEAAAPTATSIAAALQKARTDPPRAPLAPALMKALHNNRPSRSATDAALAKLLGEDTFLLTRTNQTPPPPSLSATSSVTFADLPTPLRKFHTAFDSNAESPSPPPAKTSQGYHAGADSGAGGRAIVSLPNRQMELRAEPSPSSSPLIRPDQPALARPSETPSRSPTLSDATRRESSIDPYQDHHRAPSELAHRNHWESAPTSGEPLSKTSGAHGRLPQPTPDFEFASYPQKLSGPSEVLPSSTFEKRRPSALIDIPTVSSMTAVGASQPLHSAPLFNSPMSDTSQLSPMRVFPRQEYHPQGQSVGSNPSLSNEEMDALHEAQAEAHRLRLMYARKASQPDEGRIGMSESISNSTFGGVGGGRRTVSSSMAQFASGSSSSMPLSSYPSIQIPIAPRHSCSPTRQQPRGQATEAPISLYPRSRSNRSTAANTSAIARLRSNSNTSRVNRSAASEGTLAFADEYLTGNTSTLTGMSSTTARRIDDGLEKPIQSFLDPALFRNEPMAGRSQTIPTTEVSSFYTTVPTSRAAPPRGKATPLRTVNDFYSSDRTDPSRIILSYANDQSELQGDGGRATILSKLAPTTRILFPEEKHTIICAIEAVLEMGEFGCDGGGTWGGQLAAVHSGGKGNDFDDRRLSLVSQPTRFNAIGSSSNKAMWRLFMNWIEHMRGGSDATFGATTTMSQPTTPNRRRSTTPTFSRGDANLTSVPASAPSTPHRPAHTSRSVYRTMSSSRSNTPNTTAVTAIPTGTGKGSNKRWFVKGIIPPKLVDATPSRSTPTAGFAQRSSSASVSRNATNRSTQDHHKDKVHWPRYVPLKMSTNHLSMVATALSTHFNEWNSLAPGSLEYFVALTCLDFLVNGFKQQWRPKAVILRGEGASSHPSSMSDAQVLTISRRRMADVLEVMLSVDLRDE